jgi:ubiquinone/menaquinone biosynthesis C-methylase UbiE
MTHTSAKINFDLIAPVYDFLSRLIFGNSIRAGQLHFINKITPDSSILIVGGGTGWYLEKILTTTQCKKIVYVDSSVKMIELSKKKIAAINHSCEIVFINSTIEEISFDYQFDIVVTNFFLDLFEDRLLTQITKKLYSALKNDGLWLFCDFIKNKNSLHNFWQNILIKITFLFFKLFSNVQNNQLRDYEKYFYGLKMIKEFSHAFYLGMIDSSVFKK